MAHIVIHFQGLSDDGEGQIIYGGVARCSGMTNTDLSIPWNAYVAVGALAATVNTAIKDAAIAAAEAEPYNYTIGALDKKTLLGGAVGL